jgi:hypothetical protein
MALSVLVIGESWYCAATIVPALHWGAWSCCYGSFGALHDFGAACLISESELKPNSAKKVRFITILVHQSASSLRVITQKQLVQVGTRVANMTEITQIYVQHNHFFFGEFT